MGLLTAKNVTKKFGGLTAVSGVSFSVQQGEVKGLIGPNGAGKTTLFNMIACAFGPTEGEIVFDNTPIVGKKPYQICDLGIARTFQITKTFGDLSCLENIMVGAFHKHPKVTDAKKKALEIFNLLGFSADPDQNAENLTTVDRKKIEVARALATDPKILLLDEVMAGCNPTEKQELSQVILKINRDQRLTVFIIEHDIKTIMQLCGSILLLHRGELLIEGTPDQVANNPEAISAYLGEEYKGA